MSYKKANLIIKYSHAIFNNRTHVIHYNRVKVISNF
jgi:hypothetical protein